MRNGTESSTRGGEAAAAAAHSGVQKMGLPQPWLCAPLPFAAGCRVLTNRPAMSVPKQKPVFSGIEALRPDTSGWTLVVKVGGLVGRGSGGAAGTTQGGPGPARGAPHRRAPEAGGTPIDAIKWGDALGVGGPTRGGRSHLAAVVRPPLPRQAGAPPAPPTT